jgi:hypothetical protein
MKKLLLLCALALTACAHDPNPSAPRCRDDENFVSGRCEPRIPGDRQPPGGIPPWTRP